jgi:LCP family protein required for cell wall assembly
MTFDRTEQLIRDSFHDEAARAVDGREVLANVRRQKPRRSHGLVLAAAAVVVVVAAVAAFVVPEVFQRSNGTPPVGDQQEQTTQVTPMNVLVVGVDGTDNTDSIVLTQVNADGSVSLVSLPRDSQVTTPTGENKLKQVYREAGMDALVTTVRDLTGVEVEHYVVVDMAAVGDLVDVVGGVPVCLNAATKDQYSGADFAAGEQILGGSAALAFVRQRHGLPNGDLDRIVRLQTLVRSLTTKLKGADLGKVVNAVQEKVRPDPGLDVLDFATNLVNATALRFATIPVGVEDFDTPNGAVLPVDPTQVKELVTALPSTPPATDDVPCVN